jgi:hypothetical protein
MLGRSIHLPFGDSKIFPNQYVMLIGVPGTRKSSAINTVRKLMQSAGYTAFAPNNTTKEKFLIDLHKGTETAEGFTTIMDILGESRKSEIMIPADEFTDFIGAGNAEFPQLLGVLWDNVQSYEVRMKNSPSFKIAEPCVNILSGSTTTMFANAFDPKLIGQGYTSRLILVHGNRTGVKITIPPAPDKAQVARFSGIFQRIRAELRGAVSFNQEAYDAIDWIYANWDEIDDIRFNNYGSRRHTHLLKLAMTFASLECRMEVVVEDVISAHTLLCITEEEMPKALGEIGKGRHSEVANKAVEYISSIFSSTNKSVEMQDIWKHVCQDLDGIRQLGDVLQGLTQAGKIQQVRGGYLPVVRPKKDTGKYFDLTLIGGR